MELAGFLAAARAETGVPAPFLTDRVRLVVFVVFDIVEGACAASLEGLRLGVGFEAAGVRLSVEVAGVFLGEGVLIVDIVESNNAAHTHPKNWAAFNNTINAGTPYCQARAAMLSYKYCGSVGDEISSNQAGGTGGVRNIQNFFSVEFRRATIAGFRRRSDAEVRIAIGLWIPVDWRRDAR